MRSNTLTRVSNNPGAGQLREWRDEKKSGCVYGGVDGVTVQSGEIQGERKFRSSSKSAGVLLRGGEVSIPLSSEGA